MIQECSESFWGLPPVSSWLQEHMERAVMALRTAAIHFLQHIKVAVEVAALIGQQLTLAGQKAEIRIKV